MKTEENFLASNFDESLPLSLVIGEADFSHYQQAAHPGN